MFGQAHAEVKVTRPSATHARFTFASHPNPLPLLHALRDLHAEAMGLRRAGAGVGLLKRDRPDRAVQHFGQGNEQVALTIIAPLGESPVSLAETPGLGLSFVERGEPAVKAASAPAKELFEEIAKASAAEPEFEPFTRSAFGEAALPTWGS